MEIAKNKWDLGSSHGSRHSKRDITRYDALIPCVQRKAISSVSTSKVKKYRLFRNYVKKSTVRFRKLSTRRNGSSWTSCSTIRVLFADDVPCCPLGHKGTPRILGTFTTLNQK